MKAGNVGFVDALKKEDEFHEEVLREFEVFYCAFREVNHLHWHPRVFFEEFSFSAMVQSNDLGSLVAPYFLHSADDHSRFVGLAESKPWWVFDFDADMPVVGFGGLTER